MVKNIQTSKRGPPYTLQLNYKNDNILLFAQQVFFMAVLSLNLAPYSIQDVQSTSRPPISNSTSTDKVKRITPQFQNQTSLTPPTSYATSTSNFTILPSQKKAKKKRVVKRKRKSKSADNASAHSRLYEVKAPQDLQTKSDMQILQYYAQPLNTIDLNVPPVSTYDYDSLPGSNAFSSMNQNSLFVTNSNYMTAIPTNPLPPTVAPLHIPYKTLPQNEFGHPELAPRPFSLKHINYNWNPPPEAHHFKPIPILDPFNLYRRPRPVKYRGSPVHAQKIIATAKPVTSSVSMLPPVSVTHVYKYTDNNGLKIPFLQPDDSLDDSIPILSAALNEHLHERITNVGMKNYLTPPKIGQPFLYNMPLTLSPLSNELQLLNKYNAELHSQIHQSADEHPDSDEVNETQEEKNYTDDDVKKALEYIQNLKKDKSTHGRGSKKYRNGGDESAESKSSRKTKKKPKENAEYEDEDEDESDGKRGTRRRRKKPKNKEHIFEEDDDFQLEPFSDDDKTQEESKKSIVKAGRQDHRDHVRSQESQIVPSVDEEVRFFCYI